MFANSRNLAIAGALGTALWLGTALAAVLHAAPQRRVQLTDGRELQGIVLPATECTWLVQSDDLCLELTAAQIRRVDGKEGVSALLANGATSLLRTQTFDDVLPDGDLLLHSSFTRFNDGTARVDHLQWGLAPHELDLLPGWQTFDEFGNALQVRIETQANGGAIARAPLVRPIVPGETLRFSSRLRREGFITREGDVLRYADQGDYPEDRLVTKMVRLPAGAQIVSVSPEPVQRFELDGRPYVLWRRYYVAGEKRPLEIRYRLAVGN